jgi:hypothetical protein
MDGANYLRCGAMMALLLAALPGPARAENCRDRVLELSAQYRIETDPPTVPPGEMRKPVTPDDLARSGGVVEPPPTSDPSVVTPPRSHSGMPTLPDIAPLPPKAVEAEARTMPKLDPAEATTLQALLVAARAQAERGMEQECLDGLRKAQRMLEHKR